MRPWLGGMTLLAVVLLTASAAPADPPQSAPGTASGTMTANGKAVNLKFAQAMKDERGWIVLLVLALFVIMSGIDPVLLKPAPHTASPTCAIKISQRREKRSAAAPAGSANKITGSTSAKPM